MDDARSHVRRAIHDNQLGNFRAALTEAENAIALGDRSSLPCLCAAFAAARLTGDESALRWLDQAVAAEPSNPLALAARADLLRQLDRPREALADARQWQAAEPLAGAAHRMVAQLQRALGEDEAAVESYHRAAQLERAPAQTLTDLAIVLVELGRPDAADRAVEQALAADRRFAAAWYTRTGIRRPPPGDADVDQMERLLAERTAQANPTPRSDPAAERDQILLRFALAAVYAPTDPERARAHLDAGNRLKRASLQYDPDVDARRMQVIAAEFPADTISTLRSAGVDCAAPIFIVGMPRSGTTLVEQILASHPDVQAGGESPHMERCLRDLGGDYPHQILGIPAERLRRLAHRYLELSAPAPPATRITDKMPYNFLHVGLIHALLPQARIIHCVRDPLDTCISCYATLFTRGHEFSYDLVELGRYHREYSRLMAHWRAVIPAERLIEIRYEDVVGNLEGSARRLLEACGLPWSSSCLDFHATVRPVRTASVLQVRRPLYRESIGRSHRFGGSLEPLRRALEGR